MLYGKDYYQLAFIYNLPSQSLTKTFQIKFQVNVAYPESFIFPK